MPTETKPHNELPEPNDEADALALYRRCEDAFEQMCVELNQLWPSARPYDDFTLGVASVALLNARRYEWMKNPRLAMPALHQELTSGGALARWREQLRWLETNADLDADSTLKELVLDLRGKYRTEADVWRALRTLRRDAMLAMSRLQQRLQSGLAAMGSSRR